MARRRKELILPHLNDCGGDLTKNWYVEYSMRHPQTGKMIRNRTYDGINRFDTPKERYDFANKLIKSIQKDITDGKRDFVPMVDYLNNIGYPSESGFSQTRKAEAGTINIYLSEFIQLKELEVNKKSLETYRSKLRIFSLYSKDKGLDSKPVSCYTNTVITDFLRDLARRKQLSRRSIDKYEQILHSFFKYLVKKKVIMENPVIDIPKIGIVKDQAPAAIPKHIRQVIKSKILPADPQLWLFIEFMYYMGIRPGQELRLMRLSQIDYDAKKLIVPNYIAKNGETEAIDIPDKLYDNIVSKWKLHTYNQSWYVFGRYFEPGEKHLSINDMSKRFNAFRNQLKLPKDIKLYSWKHTGAQELAAQGASIYEIQRHLRHKNIATTEMYLKKRIGPRSDMIKHHFPEI